MRIRKKKWVKPFLDEENKYLLKDLKDFNTSKPIYLEIGMGMGDFITKSAKLNNEIFYIGLEKDETCVARAIKKAQEYDLNNFKVLLLDASKLSEVFDNIKVKRIYLHFSDPWPKKGHHKRRLTYPTFLKLYESILEVDGELIFKTDNLGLFDDSLEYFKESNFNLVNINRNYSSISFNEPMTAYQEKFVNMGLPIYFAHYKL